MRKTLLLLILTLFSFSAIHAQITSTLSDDGTLTISGTGNMPDFSINVNNRTTAPWDSQRDKIKTVVIKDGVTSIGKYAFFWCSGLTSITIPNSVTSIGEHAFANCSSLTSITIPNSVTSIGDGAFSGCSGLTSITIPNSVTSIGNGAFLGCSGLTSITIPNSVKSIGNQTFWLCSGLTSITIPNSVTSIGNETFWLCSGLTSVTIPNSVTSLGKFAFYGCSGLTSITIPNSVTNIEKSAFLGCTGLTSITIPNSVTSIGDYAFDGCSGLTSITFEGSRHPKFGNDVFDDVDKSIPVYVPSISIDEYKEALGGWDFSNIQAIPPISLKDNEAYTQDSQVDGVDVSYNRNFTNTNWQALYLPFSLKYEDWKDDFEIAYINAISQEDNNDDGKIDKTVLEFVKITGGSTAPNTPYLIRAKKTGEKTISVENTTVYPAEKNSIDCSTTTATFTFTGTYNDISSYLSLMVNTFYVIDGDKLSRATISKHPKAFQWYMTIKSRNDDYAEYDSNTAKEITISVIDEEEATGIRQMQMTNDELPVYNSSVYDMNGRKINENSLKPGMYIKNGRKIIIK